MMVAGSRGGLSKGQRSSSLIFFLSPLGSGRKEEQNIEPKIPDVTIIRLPTYLRVLNDIREEGAEIVSSAQMSARTGYSSEQIRKDLAYFGAFGTRGLGYKVDLLEQRIRRILGLEESVPIALVGAGKLGQALTQYSRIQHQNLQIVALFDVAPQLIGKEIAGLRVKPFEMLSEITQREGIRLAIIAVPRDAAQEVLDVLVENGIRAVLNFAPVHLEVPSELVVRTVDLTSELQSLAYYARDGTKSW